MEERGAGERRIKGNRRGRKNTFPTAARSFSASIRSKAVVISLSSRAELKSACYQRR